MTKKIIRSSGNVFADIGSHDPFHLESGTILMPPGISSREGMWVREAWIRLGMKEYAEKWGRGKLWKAVWKLKDILVGNPHIEVFTIDSKSGTIEDMDRVWLQGRNCTNFLLMGYRNSTYRRDLLPEGKVFFINRAQFETYLNDGSIAHRIDNPQISNSVSALVEAQSPILAEISRKLLPRAKKTEAEKAYDVLFKKRGGENPPPFDQDWHGLEDNMQKQVMRNDFRAIRNARTSTNQKRGGRRRAAKKVVA